MLEEHLNYSFIIVIGVLLYDFDSFKFNYL